MNYKYPKSRTYVGIFTLPAIIVISVTIGIVTYLDQSTAKGELEVVAGFSAGVLLAIFLMVYSLMEAVNTKIGTRDTDILVTNLWGKTSVFLYTDITELNLSYDNFEALGGNRSLNGGQCWLNCSFTVKSGYKCKFHYTIIGFEDLCRVLVAKCPPSAKKINTEKYEAGNMN